MVDASDSNRFANDFSSEMVRLASARPERAQQTSPGQGRASAASVPPPWVQETGDCRPSAQRCFIRSVTEAETYRGLVAASTNNRPQTDVTPRPRFPLTTNPGRRQCSQDSHCLALGYIVKPLQGNVVSRLARCKVALSSLLNAKLPLLSQVQPGQPT